MKPDVRTVVVLRALGLGDLCTSVPALRALRRSFPDADIALAAPSWQEPLARSAGASRVVDTSPLTPLDPSLHGADIAVNLHGRGPESTSLLAAIGPGRLIAFHEPEADADLHARVTWRPDEHEVLRWCRLLTESGIDADAGQLGLPRPDAAPLVPSGAVVVHPGAAAPARRWPADRFGRVVASLLDRGERVVLTGTAGERELCDAVVHAAGEGAAGAVEVLAGRTDLVELAVTVADASLVVANDTGVAHLATAFDVPSVVLFGPTPPSSWGPPGGSLHRALWAGSRGDPHGTRLDPGLSMIQVEDVMAAVRVVTGQETRRVPA